MFYHEHFGRDGVSAQAALFLDFRDGSRAHAVFHDVSKQLTQVKAAVKVRPFAGLRRSAGRALGLDSRPQFHLLRLMLG